MRKTNMLAPIFFLGFLTACSGGSSPESQRNDDEIVKDTVSLIPEKESVIEPEVIEEKVVNENRVPLLFEDSTLKNSEKIVDFRYRGVLINPLILEEFVKFAVSDRFSSIREVDLTIGNESNRYYYNADRLYAEKRGDLTFIVYPEQENNPDNRLYLQYAYLGKLKNGLHIVILEEIQQTSNDYKTLLALRFHSEKVYYDDQPHTFITCVKTEAINQYVTYKIDSPNNRVEVIPVGNYTQSDFDELPSKSYWIKF
jgi:hypothetical protein